MPEPIPDFTEDERHVVALTVFERGTRMRPMFFGKGDVEASFSGDGSGSAL